MKYMIALLSLIMLGFTSVSMADEHVALFKNATGDLKLMRGQSVIVPEVGTHIFKSDVIVSGANASCGIAFKDGTLLTVGASSEVEISQYVFEPEEAKYDFALYLKKGSAIYSSGKLGKISPESVKVNTPKATVGVRGTRFIIKAD
jgi:hypothetical protein